MPIEIEKKYRLTSNQRTTLLQRLPEIGAKRTALEFEENTIYMGRNLEAGTQVLRLRIVGDSAILAYKQRLPGPSPIKRAWMIPGPCGQFWKRSASNPH